MLVLLQATGCASFGARRAQDSATVPGPQPATEAARLDVGIYVFDPGLPEPGEELPERVYPAIRQAESIFFSCLLRSSLRESGSWGDVRVVPPESDVSELTLHGLIVSSDGAEVVLEIEARDAAGKTWMSRRYATEVNEVAYLTPGSDPYQAMFNSVANDLARLQLEHPTEELVKLREISQLRYGAEFVPEKFEGYLEEQDGELRAVRLPAEDDPVFQQIQQARAYESMFVGTLDAHYQNFCNEMEKTYADWRGAARQEAELYSDLKTQRNWRIAMIPVVIGLVVAAAMFANNSIADYMAIMLGSAVIAELVGQIKEKNADAAMHMSMLEELDTSFSGEMRPMVVETEETTVRLSGNVEEQYAQWRRLLQELYAQTETLASITLTIEPPEPPAEPAAAAEASAPEAATQAVPR